MEKFCDFITNPNWWSVIATFVAAIVAAGGSVVKL